MVRSHPELRAGAPIDARTIAALATQVFLDTYATEGVRPDLADEALSECSPEAFAQRLAEADRRFIVAHRGDALVGFAEVLLSPHVAPAGGCIGAELVRLYVQPKAQRAGVGRRLLQAAEAAAFAAGADAIWLTAWERNLAALAFYERVGYAQVGNGTYTFQGRSYGTRVLVKRAAGFSRTA